MGAGMHYTFRRGYQIGASGGGALTETARRGAHLYFSRLYPCLGIHPPDCTYVGAYKDDPRCPPEDGDEDGIPDPQDGCPQKPEDPDGHEDEDGCPDLDNDSDGIPDETDQCPDEAEDQTSTRTRMAAQIWITIRTASPTRRTNVLRSRDAERADDEDGCPEADRDSDGILDAEDNRPTQRRMRTGTRTMMAAPTIMMATASPTAMTYATDQKIRMAIAMTTAADEVLGSRPRRKSPSPRRFTSFLARWSRGVEAARSCRLLPRC